MKSQIELLAEFILHEIPGEPSQNEGVGECAIRIIKELRAEVGRKDRHIQVAKSSMEKTYTPDVLSQSVMYAELCAALPESEQEVQGEMNVDHVFADVAAELIRAEEKHGGMPDDLIHCATIVSEESGELIRAAIQYTYEGGNVSSLRTEAIQTAAMAVKLILALDRATKQGEG